MPPIVCSNARESAGSGGKRYYGRRTASVIVFVLLACARFAPTVLGETLTFESGENPTTLLELFSSEGCSSCPPAEEWVGNLKNRPELWRSIIPVVFHVDYWDGLGWPDRFASREFTVRQRDYSAAWGSNSVYTPGFVVDGKEWRGSLDPLPAQRKETIGRLRVTLIDRGKAEIIFIPIRTARSMPIVELALLGNNLESDVKRGENGGRKLHHDFVVLSLSKANLTEDGNKWIASILLPKDIAAEPTALAAWVKEGAAKSPLQATGGWLGSPRF
jgi:hypothetical protein